MLALSAAIGATSGVIGLVVSYHADIAAGGTIVLVATAFSWHRLAPGLGYGFVASRFAGRRRERSAESATHDPASNPE